MAPASSVGVLQWAPQGTAAGEQDGVAEALADAVHGGVNPEAEYGGFASVFGYGVR